MIRQQFTSNVEATQRALRRFLVALCCGDSSRADDIAQESYLKAYLSLDKLDDPCKFKPWVFRIAYNTFISQYRKTDCLCPLEDAKVNIAPDIADSGFKYQALYLALEMLTPKERTSILLYYMQGYSIKEISQIENTSESAVKQHLSRGRIHLRDFIQNIEDGTR